MSLKHQFYHSDQKVTIYQYTAGLRFDVKGLYHSIPSIAKLKVWTPVDALSRDTVNNANWNL
jgi:hypothetical protein